MLYYQIYLQRALKKIRKVTFSDRLYVRTDSAYVLTIRTYRTDALYVPF